MGTLHLALHPPESNRPPSLAPQTRLLCALILVLAIALTPNGHWLTWAIYGIAILGIACSSRVSGVLLLQRLSVESAFIGTVLLGTLFREGGEIVWQWGILRITTTGLMVLGSVSIKALLSLTVLNLLTLTTPIPDLLQALNTLKTPPLLVAVLASMVRYIAVLIEEFDAMRRAALSRNLMNSRRWHRLVVGNMIGSLFIRTYERGERVYQAMLSRGYQGVPLFQASPSLKGWDWTALVLTTALVLMGQGVYWLAPPWFDILGRIPLY